MRTRPATQVEASARLPYTKRVLTSPLKLTGKWEVHPTLQAPSMRFTSDATRCVVFWTDTVDNRPISTYAEVAVI